MKKKRWEKKLFYIYDWCSVLCVYFQWRDRSVDGKLLTSTVPTTTTFCWSCPLGTVAWKLAVAWPKTTATSAVRSTSLATWPHCAPLGPAVALRSPTIRWNSCSRVPRTSRLTSSSVTSAFQVHAVSNVYTSTSLLLAYTLFRGWAVRATAMLSVGVFGTICRPPVVRRRLRPYRMYCG